MICLARTISGFSGNEVGLPPTTSGTRKSHLRVFSKVRDFFRVREHRKASIKVTNDAGNIDCTLHTNISPYMTLNLCVWCEYFVINAFDCRKTSREQNQSILTDLNKSSSQIPLYEFLQSGNTVGELYLSLDESFEFDNCHISGRNPVKQGLNP